MNTEKFTKEQKDVLNAIKQMTSAFQNKNIDRVMESYETNAIVIFEPGQPISNQEDIRDMFSAMAQLNPIFTYSGHEVFITGNIATHFAPWSMTGITPDGTEIKQNGLSVAVLRQQKNGDWLIILDNPNGQSLMAENIL